MASTMEMACEERRDFADFLSTLTHDQWDQPSLCRGWRVRDVVAHALSFDELTIAGLIARFAKGALIVNRINAMGVEKSGTLAPDQLVQRVRDHIRPRGLTAGFGGMIALVDGMIHQQDIRRPLGLPRVVPTERLRRVLDYALYVPLIRGAWRARGVRLVATDLDWAHGRGPEVRGAGEALLMVMAGRADALADVSGPGKARLQQHIRVP